MSNNPDASPIDKLKMHSPDLTAQNMDKIAALFPGCVTEATGEDGTLRRAIDFDLLRQELSDSIVEGPQERYHLDWPGKRQALITANAPIAKTLRPVREESVDFDTTQNLFIEGDNLEALKLLQETYLGKVKMIYIDPPYNTGNDFVYDDDFSETTAEFLERSNQTDEAGNRLVANMTSNGRFHSDWLSMVYPRLKLARNLLSDDGVVFSSIDSNESHNLKRVMDEVFGPENFVSESVVVSNPRGRQSDAFIAGAHDSLLIYSRAINQTRLDGIPLTASQKKEFNLSDDDGELYRLLGLRQRGAASNREERPDMYFPIYVNPETLEISVDEKPGWSEVLPKKSDGRDGRWMWGKTKCQTENYRLVARMIDRRNEFDVFVKDFLERNGATRTRKPKSIWDAKSYNNQAGTQEVKALLGGDFMSFPKPLGLLEDVIRMGLPKSGICMDFFAGSATSAHATLRLNSQDGGDRRFLMVQLPEALPEKSKAAKAGYSTIADISKERIRRAGVKILEGETHPYWNRDVGFRVLKIDSSNMANVYYTPDATTQADLLTRVDNIKPDRSPEDLLFQVLLDWGVDLTLLITRETLHGKTVFTVAGTALAACFDNGVDEVLVKDLAARKPMRVVFRDTGFKDDATKINVKQIFKSLSPDTDVKAI